MSMFEAIFRRRGAKIENPDVNLADQAKAAKAFPDLARQDVEALRREKELQRLEEVAKKRAENLSRIKRIKDIMSRVSSAVMDATDHSAIDRFQEKQAEFSKLLMAKYPDVFKYHVYHALFSSTPRDETTILDDFPGDDSVEKFAQKLLIEFGK